MDLAEHTEIVDGWVWPKADTECRKVVFKTAPDMLPALEHCKQKRTVIQAGGNCGVWPKWLSGHFDKVVTCEPDELNFFCLTLNIGAAKNIRAHPYALGSRPTQLGMVRDETNIGAHYMTAGSDVLVVTIDYLNADDVDFICLDVEGFELVALKGAVETIRRCRPVIQIEDKGLSNKYGYAKGDAEHWLSQVFGYRVAHRIHRDVILVPDKA